MAVHVSVSCIRLWVPWRRGADLKIKYFPSVWQILVIWEMLKKKASFLHWGLCSSHLSLISLHPTWMNFQYHVTIPTLYFPFTFPTWGTQFSSTISASNRHSWKSQCYWHIARLHTHFAVLDLPCLWHQNYSLYCKPSILSLSLWHWALLCHLHFFVLLCKLFSACPSPRFDP